MRNRISATACSYSSTTAPRKGQTHPASQHQHRACEEHLGLAKKNFPDPDVFKNYLVNRGVKVWELASGA